MALSRLATLYILLFQEGHYCIAPLAFLHPSLILHSVTHFTVTFSLSLSGGRGGPFLTSEIGLEFSFFLSFSSDSSGFNRTAPFDIRRPIDRSNDRAIVGAFLGSVRPTGFEKFGWAWATLHFYNVLQNREGRTGNLPRVLWQSFGCRDFQATLPWY